jgi:hypothetical protein
MYNFFFLSNIRDEFGEISHAFGIFFSAPVKYNSIHDVVKKMSKPKLGMA